MKKKKLLEIEKFLCNSFGEIELCHLGEKLRLMATATALGRFRAGSLLCIAFETPVAIKYFSLLDTLQRVLK